MAIFEENATGVVSRLKRLVAGRQYNARVSVRIRLDLPD